MRTEQSTNDMKPSLMIHVCQIDSIVSLIPSIQSPSKHRRKQRKRSPPCEAPRGLYPRPADSSGNTTGPISSIANASRTRSESSKWFYRWHRVWPLPGLNCATKLCRDRWRQKSKSHQDYRMTRDNSRFKRETHRLTDKTI